jgi:hypothetical protein
MNKKYYMIAVIVIIALAACSDEEIVGNSVDPNAWQNCRKRHLFMDSVLHAYGPTVYLNNSFDDPGLVYNITTPSPVSYSFKTEKEVYYYYLNQGSTDGCSVNIYKDEPGVQKMKFPRGGSNILAILLKEFEGSQFIHYLWSSYTALKGLRVNVLLTVLPLLPIVIVWVVLLLLIRKAVSPKNLK